jgi:hypothetical protein
MLSMSDWDEIYFRYLHKIFFSIYEFFEMREIRAYFSSQRARKYTLIISVQLYDVLQEKKTLVT